MLSRKLSYNCPSCKSELESPRYDAGKTDICPVCQCQLEVPDPRREWRNDHLAAVAKDIEANNRLNQIRSELTALMATAPKEEPAKPQTPTVQYVCLVEPTKPKNPIIIWKEIVLPFVLICIIMGMTVHAERLMGIRDFFFGIIVGYILWLLLWLFFRDWK